MAGAVALGIGLAPSAQAGDLGGHRLTVGGFGTLAMDYQGTNGLEFRRSVAQPYGVEAHQLNFSNDSLAGLQINAAWNQQLEAVVQVVSSNTVDHRWRPRLTRGFLRYTPGPAITLRLGRLGYPSLPFVDSANIGYSYVTVRPLIAPAATLPNLFFDGADATYTHPVGSGLLRLKIFGGRQSGAIALPRGATASLSGSSTWGAVLHYRWKNWVVSLGGVGQRLGHPASIKKLTDGLRQTGNPQAQHLAEELDSQSRISRAYFGAISYSGARWQGQFVAVGTDTGGPIGPQMSFYGADLGYRISAFTPFALISRARNAAQVQSTGLPDTPQYAALNQGTYAVQTTGQVNQSDVAVGMRYDFAPDMDLKFQVDHIWEQGSVLVLDHNNPPREHAQLTLFAVAFDFIF